MKRNYRLLALAALLAAAAALLIAAPLCGDVAAAEEAAGDPPSEDAVLYNGTFLTANGMPIAATDIEFTYYDAGGDHTEQVTTDADGGFGFEIPAGCTLANEVKVASSYTVAKSSITENKDHSKEISLTAAEYSYVIEIFNPYQYQYLYPDSITASYSVNAESDTRPVEFTVKNNDYDSDCLQAAIDAVPGDSIRVSLSSEEYSFSTVEKTEQNAYRLPNFAVDLEFDIDGETGYACIFAEYAKSICVHQRTDADASYSSIRDSTRITAGNVEFIISDNNGRTYTGSSAIGEDGFAYVPSCTEKIRFDVKGYDVVGYIYMNYGLKNGYPVVADKTDEWYSVDYYNNMIFGAWADGAPETYEIKFTIEKPESSVTRGWLFEKNAAIKFFVTENKYGEIKLHVANDVGNLYADDACSYRIGYCDCRFEGWLINDEKRCDTAQIVVDSGDTVDGVACVSAVFSEAGADDGTGIGPASMYEALTKLAGGRFIAGDAGAPESDDILSATGGNEATELSKIADHVSVRHGDVLRLNGNAENVSIEVGEGGVLVVDDAFSISGRSAISLDEYAVIMVGSAYVLRVPEAELAIDGTLSGSFAEKGTCGFDFSLTAGDGTALSFNDALTYTGDGRAFATASLDASIPEGIVDDIAGFREKTEAGEIEIGDVTGILDTLMSVTAEYRQSVDLDGATLAVGGTEIAMRSLNYAASLSMDESNDDYYGSTVAFKASGSSANKESTIEISGNGAYSGSFAELIAYLSKQNETFSSGTMPKLNGETTYAGDAAIASDGISIALDSFRYTETESTDRSSAYCNGLIFAFEKAAVEADGFRICIEDAEASGNGLLDVYGLAELAESIGSGASAFGTGRYADFDGAVDIGRIDLETKIDGLDLAAALNGFHASGKISLSAADSELPFEVDGEISVERASCSYRDAYEDYYHCEDSVELAIDGASLKGKVSADVGNAHGMIFGIESSGSIGDADGSIHVDSAAFSHSYTETYAENCAHTDDVRLDASGIDIHAKAAAVCAEKGRISISASDAAADVGTFRFDTGSANTDEDYEEKYCSLLGVSGLHVDATGDAAVELAYGPGDDGSAEHRGMPVPDISVSGISADAAVTAELDSFEFKQDGWDGTSSLELSGPGDKALTMKLAFEGGPANGTVSLDLDADVQYCRDTSGRYHYGTYLRQDEAVEIDATELKAHAETKENVKLDGLIRRLSRNPGNVIDAESSSASAAAFDVTLTTTQSDTGKTVAKFASESFKAGFADAAAIYGFGKLSMTAAYDFGETAEVECNGASLEMACPMPVMENLPNAYLKGGALQSVCTHVDGSRSESAAEDFEVRSYIDPETDRIYRIFSDGAFRLDDMEAQHPNLIVEEGATVELAGRNVFENLAVYGEMDGAATLSPDGATFVYKDVCDLTVAGRSETNYGYVATATCTDGNVAVKLTPADGYSRINGFDTESNGVAYTVSADGSATLEELEGEIVATASAKTYKLVIGDQTTMKECGERTSLEPDEKEGYTFDGWFDGTDIYDEYYVMPARDATLTATWRVDATVSDTEDGVLVDGKDADSVVMTESQLHTAYRKMIEEDDLLTIRTATSTVSFDRSSVWNLYNRYYNNLKLTSTIGKIIGPEAAPGKDVRLVLSLDLSVGDKPVHELGGVCTVELAYELEEGQQAEFIKVYYIDGFGRAVDMGADVFDNGDGTVAIRYTTTHLSDWAVCESHDIDPTVTMEGWTYGEEPSAPAVEGNLGGGDVTYTYAVKGSGEFGSEVPTDAGEYTVKAEIAAAGDYNAGEATTDFTISKAPLSISVSVKGWTAGGEPSEPAVAGNLGDGKVTYTYAVAGTELFLPSVPTVAGDYTVKAVVAETMNYLGAEATADFSIAKRAAPSAEPGLDDTMLYIAAVLVCVLGLAGAVLYLRRR